MNKDLPIYGGAFFF
ncbi:hypothetical protein D032_4617A, partial [Vibrio parahaemolyticus V14/01]